MDVAAAGFAAGPADAGGDPLMHPQVHPGGRVGGDPHPPHAQVYVGRKGHGLIFFLCDVAAGHLARKLAEYLQQILLAPHQELVLPCAEPRKIVVKQALVGGEVVFAVVLMDEEARYLDGGFLPPGV